MVRTCRVFPDRQHIDNSAPLAATRASEGHEPPAFRHLRREGKERISVHRSVLPAFFQAGIAECAPRLLVSGRKRANCCHCHQYADWRLWRVFCFGLRSEAYVGEVGRKRQQTATCPRCPSCPSDSIPPPISRRELKGTERPGTAWTAGTARLAAGLPRGGTPPPNIGIKPIKA